MAALGARAWLYDRFLFLHGVRLARIAQRVRGRSSLPTLMATMASLRALPRCVDPVAAQRAAGRACGRAARWLGHRDTCLVRSLVLAALLSDRELVLLHVGFAPPRAGGGLLEGHAWISVDGQVVGGEGAAMSGDGAVTEIALPVRRPGS